MGVQDRAIASTVLKAIDHAAVNRWDDAVRRAATTHGTVDARVAQVTASISKELAAVGATTGGVAALPGVGTIASLATSAADVGWTTTRSADTVMVIAAIHERTEATADERRAWIIAVLGYGRDAPAAVERILAAERAAQADARRDAKGRLSGGSLAALNQGFVRNLVTKWVFKKLATSVGKALPFGIGAVVGGVANRSSARTVAGHAHHLFTVLGAAPEGHPTPAPSLTEEL